MPRRVKPPGLKNWTWAEIDAGRKMSKFEKRWNRIGKDRGWTQRPDGGYTPTPQDQPWVVVAIIFMLAVAASSSGGKMGAVGAAILAGLLVVGGIVFVALKVLKSAVGLACHPTTQSSASMFGDRLASLIVWLWLGSGKIGGRLWHIATLKRASGLPDWALPIVWGLLIPIPIIALVVTVYRMTR